MATADHRPGKPAELRREIEGERALLAESVVTLRTEIRRATDVTGKLRAKLPLVAASALGIGFVVTGGVRSTARLARRRLRR